MGAELLGTNKLLIVTSGTGISSSGPGVPATENDLPVSSSVFPRAATEEAAAALTAKGVRVAVVRLPQVHDTEKQGLVTFAIQVARQKGIAAYIGEGQNRWPACPRFDAAHLYRLVLEKGEAGLRYNAVAEEGVPARAIAEAIGRGLNLPVVSLSPEEAPAHFGWLTNFMAWDIPASSAITRQKLGWSPSGPTLLTDLANMKF
jgi:nucleoside-diphosphate-sugar epimerase